MTQAVMDLLAALALLLALPCSLAQVFTNAIAGPFLLLPEHKTSCPPSMRPAKTYYNYTVSWRRDHKIPTVYYYSANMTTFIAASDNYTVFIVADSWKSRGGWAQNAFTFKFEKPFAKLAARFPKYWRMVMDYVFKDPNRKPPFEPLFATASNWSTDVELPFPPAFYYGRYRGTAWIVNSVTNERVACERAYANIVRKTRQPRCRMVNDRATCVYNLTVTMTGYKEN